MSHSTLGDKFFLKNEVIKAERKFRRGTATAGKVISEQAFGFWTSLFEPKHYHLLSGSIIHCFPNKPASIDRVDIYKMLNDIREFRNRVYHNENICFDNTNIDFSKAKSIKEDIYKLLEWIDIDLKNYVLEFDSIDIEITAALCI